MLEQKLEKIWLDKPIKFIFFDINAHKHYRMVRFHQYSELFEFYRPEVTQTYQLISENLTLALTSENEYLRLFAELILKN